MQPFSILSCLALNFSAWLGLSTAWSSSCRLQWQAGAAVSTAQKSWHLVAAHSDGLNLGGLLELPAACAHLSLIVRLKSICHA